MEKKTIEVKEVQRLIGELESLGISREFIQQKGIENLYRANRIVESYDFGREITQREKRALIQAILDNYLLNIKKRALLPRLVQRFREIGLEDQEIYGAIINLGVNGRILEQTGYQFTYSDLIAGKDNLFHIVEKYKDQIDKNITRITMLTALSKTLNSSEEVQLKRELEGLGVDKAFIEQRTIRDLYMAKAVVEGYDFGRILTQQQKRALINSILDNAHLDKRPTLSMLMQVFEQIGMEEQEIYGTMINLAINGRVLEEKGYSYYELIHNKDNNWKTIVRYKDKIEKQVGKMTLLTAVSRSLDEKEQQQLISELEALGISREFLGMKDSKNLYMAKAVIEGYDFGRELTIEEKRSLIQSILSNNLLNIKKGGYLYKLMQTFEQIGLSEQEIYGALINLGVSGRLLDMKGTCTYTQLLDNGDSICYYIGDYKEKIQTDVTEDTIQCAIKKSEKIMQRAVKGQKDKGAIKEEQAKTRDRLGMLTEQEKSQKTEKEQGENDEISTP